MTFEGIEGSGKTTQLFLLAKRLRTIGFTVVTTREPGGTKIGDEIRRLLLDPNHRDMEPLTELFLYSAARAQHVSQVIRPALASGKIVLCDRYGDATRAYQGAARRIPQNILEKLLPLPTGGLIPQLTLLFDCPVEVGLARARKRLDQQAQAHEGRFEAETLDFHQRVRKGYLAIARLEPKRVKIIDALKDIAVIEQQVEKATAHVVHHYRSSKTH